MSIFDPLKKVLAPRGEEKNSNSGLLNHNYCPETTFFSRNVCLLAINTYLCTR